MKKIPKVVAVLSLAACLSLAGACAPTPPQEPTDDKPQGTVTEPEHRYTLSLSKTEFILIADDETRGSASLEATATKDGKETNGAEIEYTMADPAVAKYENGKLTAVGAGITTLTASWNGATAQASVCVHEYADVEQVNTFHEKYVNLYGRTYPGQNGVNLDNPATGIELSFFGDELDADITVSGTVYVRIFIDGDKEGIFKELKTERFAPIVSKLKRNELHTVRIVKSSEVNAGGLALNHFYAEKFVTAREKSDLKIEFIGDSISAGAGDLAKGGAITNENTDAASAFACRTGMALNADFSVVAVGGICLKEVLYPSLGFAMTDMHPWTSYRNKTPWEYDAETDIVVLGLGTNDAQFMKTNAQYQTQFPKDYQNFLTHLREIYPEAQIVCVYGMMGRNALVDQGIVKAVQQMRDENITYLRDYFTADNRGGSGHPCLASHIEYSEILTEYLTKHLQ